MTAGSTITGIPVTVAAAELDVSEQWVRKLIRDGRITAWRVSPRFQLVDVDSLAAYKASDRRAGPKTSA